jgi:hypothetical protein
MNIYWELCNGHLHLDFDPPEKGILALSGTSVCIIMFQIAVDSWGLSNSARRGFKTQLSCTVRQFRILDSERWTFTRHADPDQEDLMNYDRTRLQPTMLYPICRMHRHSATFLGFQTWRKKLPYYYASPVEGYGWQLLCYWHRVNQAMDVRKPRTVYR